MKKLLVFDRHNAEQHKLAAVIWNTACGVDLTITPGFVDYNTRPTSGAVQEGRIAILAGQPVGFILASAFTADPNQRQGWIDAIAVLPTAQRQGIGGDLLKWAFQWLYEQGSQQVTLGTSLRVFTPGLPCELEQDSPYEVFFNQHGFNRPEGHAYSWDMSHCLANYQSVYPDAAAGVELHPLQAGQEELLLAFLQRTFPGRWLFEYQEHLKEGGRLSDYLLLWRRDQIVAFCQITLPDSVRKLDRFYPHRLPHPWGQLGTIGVDENLRGQGFGGLLIDKALLYLQALGVNGCVIDWTSLLDLYGKFGFIPYRRYLHLAKTLS